MDAKRLPRPTDAERARSIVARGGAAILVGTGEPPATPFMHAMVDGSVMLVLAEGEPVLGAIAGAADGFPAMLELTDHAPVMLRDPVRGLLWLVGRLRIPPPSMTGRLACKVGELDPNPALLYIGHGADLVEFVPDLAVLSGSEGTAALPLADIAAARADPFCLCESEWLSHLEDCHPEMLAALARHLPRAVRGKRDARIRPLGIDRLGFRLRAETQNGDYDVRLPWPQALTTVDDLSVQFGLLVG